MKTKDEKKIVPSFDELVFENRNMEYGAYEIRKKYNAALLWSILVSVFFISASVITPFVILKEKPIVVESPKDIKIVTFTATPLPIDVSRQEQPKPEQLKVKAPIYIAPQIVDSLPEADANKFATNDEFNANVKNDSVTDVIPVINVDNEPTSSKNDDVIWVVEEKPIFGLGGDNEFRRWISENIIYPQLPLENGIQGRVLVQFVVERDGNLSNFTIVRSVDPELDNEAIRVLKLSPKWNPGKQQGRPVRVGYTFPITFVIK